MKKLQNNFTTPEQSKRLLELGVPADSADCYLLKTHTKGDTFIVEVLHDKLYSKKEKFINVLEYLPCWSVGRLIEIFEICTPYVFTGFYNYMGSNIEVMIKIYESVICHPVKNLIDFSELEE